MDPQIAAIFQASTAVSGKFACPTMFPFPPTDTDYVLLFSLKGSIEPSDEAHGLEKEDQGRNRPGEG